MKKTTFHSTLKSSDTEEWLDILFYRRVGYLVALMAGRLRVSPNQITVVSILLGVASGPLFFVQEIRTNLIGAALLVLANVLDSADGQLARMTGRMSRLGRWLDGLCGQLWFTSIYVFLGFRMLDDGFPVWAGVFIVLAGWCHAKQASMADYYRNLHLMFLNGNEQAEFDRARFRESCYRASSWRANPPGTFFLWSYWRYTLSQEKSTPSLQRFHQAIHERYGGAPPAGLRDAFLRESRPLMKYTNILTFNTRAVVLILAVLVDQAWLYFLFELTVLNLILWFMVRRHEGICRRLREGIEGREA